MTRARRIEEPGPRRWSLTSGFRPGSTFPVAGRCCTTDRCRSSARRVGPPAARRHGLRRRAPAGPGPRSRRCRATGCTADFHCVTKFSDHRRPVGGRPRDDARRAGAAGRRGHPRHDLGGVRLQRQPADVDFLAATTLLATHRDGERLTPTTARRSAWSYPHLYAWKSVKWVRAIEYLDADRRGFWEERGYHNVADPWREQRYSYQEDAPPGLTGVTPSVPRPRGRAKACATGDRGITVCCHARDFRRRPARRGVRPCYRC